MIFGKALSTLWMLLLIKLSKVYSRREPSSMKLITGSISTSVWMELQDNTMKIWLMEQLRDLPELLRNNNKQYSSSNKSTKPSLITQPKLHQYLSQAIFNQSLTGSQRWSTWKFGREVSLPSPQMLAYNSHQTLILFLLTALCKVKVESVVKTQMSLAASNSPIWTPSSLKTYHKSAQTSVKQLKTALKCLKTWHL